MPASQIDLKPVPHPDAYVGKAVKVVVIEMDRSKGNVLVSRRRVLEQERMVKRAATLDALGITVYPGASSSVADMTEFF